MTTTETPAALLRRAAKLMRERAEAALCDGMSAIPWRVGKKAGCSCCEAVTDATGSLIATPDDRQSAHIAGMHPGVAGAVADLLDKIAWMGELDPEMLGRVGCDEAIGIARAYLGETP